jgi:hypothetical protein
LLVRFSKYEVPLNFILGQKSLCFLGGLKMDFKSEFDERHHAWLATEGEAWAEACRQMEVCLMQRRVDLAAAVLAEFARGMAKPVDLSAPDTHVSQIFDYRSAAALESHGFLTLQSVRLATDEDLLAMGQIGPVRLQWLRRRIDAIVNKRPLARSYDETMDELTNPPAAVASHGFNDRIVAAVVSVVQEHGPSTPSEISLRLRAKGIRLPYTDVTRVAKASGKLSKPGLRIQMITEGQHVSADS